MGINEELAALMMSYKWTQEMQAFVQERDDCKYEYNYEKRSSVLYGSLEVIKEFLQLCELIDLTPNSETAE
jgi:hypothetical protein